MEDFSARLPYDVKGIITYNEDKDIFTVKGIANNTLFLSDSECCKVEDFKPYLRSMEDMTNEEYEELKSLCYIYIPSDSRNIGFEDYGMLVFTYHFTNDTYTFKLNMKVIKWLLKNHFDFMGLIEKGLAIRVTKENNPYERRD